MTTRILTERQMQDGITDAAQKLGYLYYHALISYGSVKGFCDLVIVGHGIVRFYEIKGPRGRVSAEQNAWIEALTAAGQMAQVVWPDDYDAVLADLANMATRGAR
jgi:hypothetical protein